jgi:transcriptional regulator with XRE-family HTH domain
MICLNVKRNVVGPRVRQARKLATPPVSQVDLAARLQLLGLKIDQSAISKIEQGHRPVLDTEVIALAKALKVSVAWLLGKGDTTSKAPTK